jgi:hypothetical protein
MLALKAACLHPQTKKPYITSVAGGRDNSVQGLQVSERHALTIRVAADWDPLFSSISERADARIRCHV